ncbi:MAG TPA: GNAT family N-acetyltransferase [Phycisphaerales bacterium]|nr:GNAT family N-acetyltransferase [Phycisphaerales bacterium]
MIDLRRVAQLEEARLRTGMAEVAQEHIDIAGGVATRGERGTWINSATGLGMAGPVTPADIDRLIAFHEQWGAEPRIEVCPFADKSLLECLKGRGFNVVFFENVLFRDLAAPIEPPSEHPAPRGLEIRTVNPRDEASVHEFALTGCIGFAEGKDPRPEAIALAAKCAAHPRTLAYTAFIEDKPAAAGALEVSGDIAALFGLSVLPAFRNRGLQSALIHHRLLAARDRGAKVATIGAAPGIGTERNARRAGFHVAYTRLFLTRPGEGLEAARF